MYAMCYNHIYSHAPPLSLPSHPQYAPFQTSSALYTYLFITFYFIPLYPILSTLSPHSRMWIHPLEHGQCTRGHTFKNLKTDSDNLSPIHYQLSIAPWLMGNNLKCKQIKFCLYTSIIRGSRHWYHNLNDC